MTPILCLNRIKSKAFLKFLPDNYEGKKSEDRRKVQNQRTGVTTLNGANKGTGIIKMRIWPDDYACPYYL
jgi:hypothetical protein